MPLCCTNNCALSLLLALLNGMALLQFITIAFGFFCSYQLETSLVRYVWSLIANRTCHSPLSQVVSRRNRCPGQVGQDGIGSIPATPSTKHALCFPPSSMPASIEISLKLIVCLSLWLDLNQQYITFKKTLKKISKKQKWFFKQQSQYYKVNVFLSCFWMFLPAQCWVW